MSRCCFNRDDSLTQLYPRRPHPCLLLERHLVLAVGLRGYQLYAERHIRPICSDRFMDWRVLCGDLAEAYFWCATFVGPRAHRGHVQIATYVTLRGVAANPG
jgi:hypothetical protein